MEGRLKLMALGAAFLLGACGRGDADKAARSQVTASKPAAVAPAAAPPLAADRAARQMLDAWLAAWNAHDAARAGELLAEDVEYFDAGFSGIQRGRQAAIDNGIVVFLRGMPDLQWQLRGEPIVGADSIAWEWTLSGTNTGTWGGVRATRQSIQLKGVALMRLRDGRISSVAYYYDTGTLNRQLGL